MAGEVMTPPLRAAALAGGSGSVRGGGRDAAGAAGLPAARSVLVMDEGLRWAASSSVPAGSASGFGAGAGAGAALTEASPLTVNTISSAPTATVSPGSPVVRSTVPVTGEGISTLALSVMTSAMI